MGTPWVGKFYFLHNDHSVTYVPVQEVYEETRPHLRPHLTPLYWAVLRPNISWKVNMMYLWLSHGGGSPTEISIQCHTVPRGGPQATPPPVPIHSIGTEPEASVGPGRRFRLPSYVAHMPPLTGFRPYSRGIRASNMSYWHCSGAPPGQKT